MHRLVPLLTLTLSLALAPACPPVDPLYVDPDVVLADAPDAPPPSGPAEVTLGFTEGDAFDPLAPGDPCVVVWGLQGGTWTMPTIRMKGIDAFATVACELTTDGGEVVGRATGKTRFFPALDDGSRLEVQYYPIPVYHAPPNEGAPVDDLYGQPATLSCRVTDAAGRTEAAAVAVVITSG